MRQLGRSLILASVAGTLFACTLPTPENPYPGNGGSLFREPTESQIGDTRLQFDAKKVAALRIGKSTKHEVVEMFGAPTWWETGESGFSRLEYDFHMKSGTINTPYLAPATFIFDAANILVDAHYADSYKTIHVERGPFRYAYFEGSVGTKALFLDGVVPADWVADEGVPIGGYIRAPVRVRDLIAGEVPRQNLALVFTVAGARIGPWRAYFLIKTDRFGTTSVIDWDAGPSLCHVDDHVTPELKAIVLAVRSSPICTSGTLSR